MKKRINIILIISLKGIKKSKANYKKIKKVAFKIKKLQKKMYMRVIIQAMRIFLILFRKPASYSIQHAERVNSIVMC